MANAKPPAPTLVATEQSVPVPPSLEPIPGFQQTLARRGARALTYHNAGWYGRFVYEVDAAGAAEIVCKSGLTTSAAFLDDDHLAISAGDATWVVRREAGGFRLVSGVEKVSGPITPLPGGMLAVGFVDRDGLRLLAFRDGWLRLYKGKVKPPASAPEADRVLVAGDDGRVFAVSRTDALELTGWELGADWDPSADWDKAIKKLTKSSGVPISVTRPAPAVALPDGVSVQADGSRWRLTDQTAAVEVGGSWRELSLPEPPSGAHYPEVPERERRFLVAPRLHGAVDADRGVAWLVTAGEKLIRASLATGACEIVATSASSERTVGVFPQPDGRVVVVGHDIVRIIDPTGAIAPRDDRGFTYSSALSLGGPLIARAVVRPDLNKNGVPGAWLQLLEIGAFPRTWLSWQLPLYAPSLRFDGATILTAEEGERALAFDLEAALAWFPQFAGRDDVPPLPPKATKKKK